MTAVDPPAKALVDPGWFPDPRHEHHLRYFDGRGWTDHVTHLEPEPCAGCHHPGEPDDRPSTPRAEAGQPAGSRDRRRINGKRTDGPDRRRGPADRRRD